MNALLFPGQGSQFKGMGAALFSQFPEITGQASDVLGYSISELCLQDPKSLLSRTDHTQPAIYVVNAMALLRHQQQGAPEPDFAAGHSLGEYSALLAAGAFDFVTGLKLVIKRGELMNRASGGAMLALVQTDIKTVQSLLQESGLQALDVANYNTPTQIILSGPLDVIGLAEAACIKAGIRCMPLPVSAAFHSRYMQEAAKEFDVFLKDVDFLPLRFPVIANATARPYPAGESASLLVRQIRESVRWCESVRVLMGEAQQRGEEFVFKELGDSGVLTRMVAEIRKIATPLVIPVQAQIAVVPSPSKTVEPIEPIELLHVADSPAALPSNCEQIQAGALGDAGFRRDWGIRMSYLAGSMYRGIASVDLVVALGRAGLMGFLGTGGMGIDQIRDQLRATKSRLDSKASWGANLLCNIDRPVLELQTVELFCGEGVRRVEASAFMQVTPALSLWRALGMRQDSTGHVHCDHQVLAKVSRPEVARMFMNPTPQEHLERWLGEGRITSEQARLAGMVPVSNDICVEADSGGHTDQGVAFALLPSIQSLRDAVMAQRRYSDPIRVGLAGGIGTPQAVAAAFVMKADFVLTGSINQCTVEAGTSEMVKDLLQDIDVQDTDYAPAGDMFELGARVQVLRKGVFFPARANKLYMLYTHYNSLEEIPPLIRSQIEQKYFKRSFDSIWQETRDYLITKGHTAQLEAAEKSAKARMALVFRWYFRYSSEAAMQGRQEHRVDFQVHTGPAMGAFNQWVKGTPLADWRQRHVAQIADKLMDGAAALLGERVQAWLALEASATGGADTANPPIEVIQKPLALELNHS